MKDELYYFWGDHQQDRFYYYYIIVGERWLSRFCSIWDP